MTMVPTTGWPESTPHVGTPTERERGQWYFQRYAELPTHGEIVLFDRSLYNRARVEHVMQNVDQKQDDVFVRGDRQRANNSRRREPMPPARIVSLMPRVIAVLMPSAS